GTVEAVPSVAAGGSDEADVLPQAQRGRADAEDPRGLSDGEEAVCGGAAGASRRGTPAAGVWCCPGHRVRTQGRHGSACPRGLTTLYRSCKKRHINDLLARSVCCVQIPLTRRPFHRSAS